MKVLKFGGTSVGSAQRMKSVAGADWRRQSEDCRSFGHVGDNQYLSRDFGLSL